MLNKFNVKKSKEENKEIRMWVTSLSHGDLVMMTVLKKINNRKTISKRKKDKRRKE